ncbi:hypothetical protein DAEQUDRAFT_92687 [Daedalea quercina L-15889]|uniref:Uncharacterized protein n=1 Tax=Daedalea quercina L-15889 TaxID=1314783 RepID=A0A165S8Z7_9APHY|nr:hypothetical protein DAEQUDRAFT_92687 [Daedalea quercina L-15889]
MVVRCAVCVVCVLESWPIEHCMHSLSSSSCIVDSRGARGTSGLAPSGVVENKLWVANKDVISRYRLGFVAKHGRER